jgi:hypothetical protein
MRRTLSSPAPCLSETEARWQDVKGRILAVSQHLWTQGNICRKWDRGGYVWRLRYYESLEDGRRIQRTIRIGCDPVVFKRAEELLKHCRQRKEWLDEIPRLARLVEAAAVGIRRRR